MSRETNAMGVDTYLQPVHGAEPAGEEVDIDSSWFDLAEGLSALGLDGEFLVTGNMFVATGDEDSDGDDGEGFYEGRLDSEDVLRNWQQLQGVTFEQFFAVFEGTPQGKESNDPGLHEYLEAHFTALMEVYRSAAAAGAGIRFSAC
jgi:hypothetical protein